MVIVPLPTLPICNSEPAPTTPPADTLRVLPPLKSSKEPTVKVDPTPVTLIVEEEALLYKPRSVTSLPFCTVSVLPDARLMIPRG
jgi:hypothetical protein